MKKLFFKKAKIKDCPISSFKSYNDKDTASDLNKDEITALKLLSRNK